MGKGAIILVLVSLLGWTMSHATRQETFLQTQDEQALYGERVLAREAALSGFNVAFSKTEENFTKFRTDGTTTEYKDGDFTISAVQGGNADTVAITSTGRVGRATYTISADMLYKIRSKLAALNIDGPVDFTVGLGSTYGIHGQDTDPSDKDGTYTGKGGWANGVHSILTSADAEIQSGLKADLVTGGLYGLPGSFVHGDMELELNELEQQINTGCSVPSPTCIILEGNQTFAGGDVFGTPDKPVTVVVHGDVALRGSVLGYGVLYLNGNFSTEVGTPRWEGLIYASKAGGSHELRGQPHIYGAVILRSKDPETGMSVQEGEAEENIEPINLTIRGNPYISYSSKALARVGLMVPEVAFDPPEGLLLNIRQTSNDRTDSPLEALLDATPVSDPNIF